MPLSAQALEVIAGRSPPVPGESGATTCRAELDALLAADFPTGYSTAGFEALPADRRRRLMLAVHRAALAGVDRHPAG